MDALKARVTVLSTAHGSQHLEQQRGVWTAHDWALWMEPRKDAWKVHE